MEIKFRRGISAYELEQVNDFVRQNLINLEIDKKAPNKIYRINSNLEYTFEKKGTMVIL